MNRNQSYLPLIISFSGFFLFSICTQFSPTVAGFAIPAAEGRVVIPAPILQVLYSGDRFLAANIETVRLAATGVEFGQVDMEYLMRAQGVVAELNPCHEDNYYFANGFLTWGGADREGSAVLRRATECRFWDEYPPFFYGFNKFFFEKNINVAAEYFERAAQRSAGNAASFRKFAIMIKAEQIDDVNLAIGFVKAERNKTADSKLKEMLNKRIQRLEGLALLRDAQRRFEEQSGQKLSTPDQLLESGLITVLPDDPLRLGYEFVDGRFVLKQIKFAGAEG